MTILWNWLQHNSTQISLTVILGFIIYVVLKRFGKRLLITAILKEKMVFGRPHHELSKEEQRRVETVSSLVNRFAQLFIIILAGVTVLKLIGFDLAPLLAGAGIIGIILGFGTQSLVRDLLAGLFIVFENQFVKGDIVRINTLYGKVTDLSLRTTVLRDESGVEHIIPNGQITAVSNFTKHWSAINFTVSIQYTTALAPVVAALQHVITSMTKDPAWQHYFLEQPELAVIDDFTTTAAVLRIKGKVLARQQWTVSQELRKRIFNYCQEQSITLGQ